MHQVHPSLWIANALEARDAKLLFDREVKAVVDLAVEELPAALPREFIYCRIPLLDGEANLSHALSLAIQTVADLIKAKVPTVVACSAGMSRSPTVAAFALAAVTKRPAAEIVEELREQKPIDISPALWAAVAKMTEQWD